jgi:hypothetical protein|eukprot:COSAG02_NODE_1956_length_10266_cov_30.185896_6_plen_137_part_00
MDGERIIGELCPATHTAVLLKSALTRRLNKLRNGVELERPAEKHFEVRQVETRPPSRSDQLLVKIMCVRLLIIVFAAALPVVFQAADGIDCLVGVGTCHWMASALSSGHASARQQKLLARQTVGKRMWTLEMPKHY